MGEHVPTAVERRREVDRGELLRVGVEQGGAGEGHAPGQHQVRREQPVGAWEAIRRVSAGATRRIPFQRLNTMRVSVI